jgi:hypothetical protein
MSLLMRKLMARGYWQQAGDDGAAGGGGAASTDTPAGDNTQPADGSQGDDGKDNGQGDAGDGAKPDDKQGDKGETKTGAPESYDFMVPEGVEQLDSQLVETFTPLAKELGLSNDQAQKLVDIAPQIQQRMAQQQAEAWGKQLEAWVGEVKADKVIGGDNLPATMASAQKVMQQFGTPELKAALEQTGMGNHPELVRLFAKVGKAMGEDSLVAGGKSSGGSGSIVDAFYPTKS